MITFKEKNPKQKYCLCQSMKTTLNVCRVFGLCPISWRHVDNLCCYSVSKIWILYTLLVLAINIAHLSQIMGDIKITLKNDRKLILAYISVINDNISTILTTMMILLNLFRVKKLVRLFNKCVSLSKHDLLCSPNLKIHRLMHIIFVSGFTILYAIQYIAIFMLNMMDKYDTNWTHERMLMPVIQNTPLLFTALVGTSCTIFLTLLSCFEKIMMHNLNFVPVHPMPGFDETCEARYIMGVYNYQRCNNKHKSNPDQQMDKLQTVEYLKYLHERIRDCVDLANSCFSPQMLVYMTIAIIALVLHWYAVIVFFTTENPDPEESTINFFNWLFVLIHSGGLFIFLQEAQDVETATQKLVHILMEYSTRISTPEEYQQVRIFVESLHGKKGINASGIFNVNLSIAGPIAANILMYVLVAVQFKFPSKE